MAVTGAVLYQASAMLAEKARELKLKACVLLGGERRERPLAPRLNRHRRPGVGMAPVAQPVRPVR